MLRAAASHQEMSISGMVGGVENITSKIIKKLFLCICKVRSW